MKAKFFLPLLMLVLSIILAAPALGSQTETAVKKPTPDAALDMLKVGNQRFAMGQPQHPNISPDRMDLAAKSDQGDYAIATVLACSDSRVPVELLFDAGVMDLFVVRVAGNVCRTDEIGSIEYGLAHVKTPVLVILGHTHCGAVTAVTREVLGHHNELERNIPPLIAPIFPAVKEAVSKITVADEGKIIEQAIESNVWQSMYDLFHQSPAVRKLVKDGKAKVVGAVYDIGTGTVHWLPEAESAAILAKAEAAPDRAMNAMASTQAETPKQPAAVHRTAPELARSTAALGQSNGLPAYLESIQAEVKAVRTDMAGLNQTLKTGLDDVNKVMTANMKTLEAKLAQSAPAPDVSETVKSLGSGLERQMGDIKKSVASGIQDVRGDVAALNKSVNNNLDEMDKTISSGLNGLGQKMSTNQDQALRDTMRGVGDGLNKQVGTLQLIIIIGIIVLGILVVVTAFMLRQVFLVRLDDMVARHESLRNKTRQALIGLQKQIQ